MLTHWHLTRLGKHLTAFMLLPHEIVGEYWKTWHDVWRAPIIFGSIE